MLILTIRFKLHSYFHFLFEFPTGCKFSKNRIKFINDLYPVEKCQDKNKEFDI